MLTTEWTTHFLPNVVWAQGCSRAGTRGNGVGRSICIGCGNVFPHFVHGNLIWRCVFYSNFMCVPPDVAWKSKSQTISYVAP